VRTDLALLGARLLLATIFLDSGISKFGSLDAIAAALAGKGLPLPWLGAIGATGLEVVAAAALIAGVLVAPAALALAAFTLLAGALFHGFWTVEGAGRFGERIHFLKNLAIVGGLLALAIAGPGRLALRRHATQEIAP
jgi:putative oxidoreductase